MDVPDFEQIVNTWYDPLYRFAFSLTRDTDDALDMTQSAFARYAEKGRHIRNPSRAKAWLFYRTLPGIHQPNDDAFGALSFAPTHRRPVLLKIWATSSPEKCGLRGSRRPCRTR